MGDANQDENADKDNSLVSGNWFGNLIYWIIGNVFTSAFGAAGFWCGLIGLWQLPQDLLMATIWALKSPEITTDFRADWVMPYSATSYLSGA